MPNLTPLFSRGGVTGFSFLSLPVVLSNCLVDGMKGSCCRGNCSEGNAGGGGGGLGRGDGFILGAFDCSYCFWRMEAIW